MPPQPRQQNALWAFRCQVCGLGQGRNALHFDCPVWRVARALLAQPNHDRCFWLRQTVVSAACSRENHDFARFGANSFKNNDVTQLHALSGQNRGFRVFGKGVGVRQPELPHVFALIERLTPIMARVF